MPTGGEAKARAFFVDALGFEERLKPEGLRKRGGCWFSAGGVAIHVGVRPDFRPATKAHPAIVTADLEALAARLESNGVEVRRSEVDGMRRFFVSDPFGNRLEFMGTDSADRTQEMPLR